MTEHQFPSSVVVSEQRTTFDAAEKLNVLSFQHSVLIEELRQLQLENMTAAESSKWRRLEKEVLRLRAEFEALIGRSADSSFDIVISIDGENSVN